MAHPRWTDEQDRRLIEMWRSSTVTEICISGEFNGFSRNAVIGRVYRLRKKWGSEMIPEKNSGHPPAAPKKKRRRQKTNNFNLEQAPTFARDPTPQKKLPVPPKARHLSVLELGPTDCRF